MKLVTYDAGRGPRVGALEGGGVADLGFDGDMIAFIAAGAPAGRRTPVEGARLLAPLVPRTLRDFLSFEGHMKNALSRLGRPIPQEWYSVPAYYKGFPDTVIGPEEVIPWPAYTDQLDYELEIAAVIGRPGRDIGADRALVHVFGYTIWNDLSARDVQARELPVGMGPGKAKDWDGANVLGPCIVTADELDPADLRMTVRVNGEVRGEDTSAHMHFSFGDLIAYASRAQTLRPGEVLGSGTATGGAGIESGQFLRAGDVIEMEVEGIGILRNTVGQKGSV